MDMLRWQLTSRAEFDRLRLAAPRDPADLERAAWFLYLQRTAYGGKVVGRTLRVSATNPGRFDVTKLAPMLSEIHERLAGVAIEQLLCAELLRQVLVRWVIRVRRNSHSYPLAAVHGITMFDGVLQGGADPQWDGHAASV